LHFPVLLKVAFGLYSRNRAKSAEKTGIPRAGGFFKTPRFEKPSASTSSKSLYNKDLELFVRQPGCQGSIGKFFYRETIFEAARCFRQAVLCLSAGRPSVYAPK
jgi:hypothetical protein